MMYANSKMATQTLAKIITHSLPVVGAVALTLSLVPRVVAAQLADFLFIVDESTSMEKEHAWLRNMIDDLDLALSNKGVSARYGLVGYGTPSHGIGPSQNPSTHLVGGGQFGTATQLSTAAENLVADGGREDGYEAIMFALNNYAINPNAVLNIVLITDEDRDQTTGDNYNSVLTALTSRNALLNVVVDNPFGSAPNNTGAVGTNGTSAYFGDGFGGFTTVAGSFVGDGEGNTEIDYVPMAFATKGAAWDLNQLRAGGLTAASFTEAFVDVKVEETVGNPVPEPLTIFGAGTAIGFGTFFKKELSKKKKKNKDNS